MKHLFRSLRFALALILASAFIPLGVTTAFAAGPHVLLNDDQGMQGVAGISSDNNIVLFASKEARGSVPATEGYFKYVIWNRSLNTYEAVKDNDGEFVRAAGGYGATLSADGRYVVFSSKHAMDPADTNGTWDVYLYDRETSALELVSVHTDGTGGDGQSLSAVISDDGRFVAYVSSAINLIDTDSNGLDDIYLRDRSAGTTVRVSQTPSGGQIDLNAMGVADTFAPSIAVRNGVPTVFFFTSGEGLGNSGPMTFGYNINTKAIFQTGASVPGMVSGNGQYLLRASGGHVHLYDMLQPDPDKRWMMLSIDMDGEPAPGDSLTGSYAIGISDDGRFVAFSTDAAGLTPESRQGDVSLYVVDLVAGTIEYIDSGYQWVTAGSLSPSGGAIMWQADYDNVYFATLSALDPTKIPLQPSHVTISPTTFVYDGTEKEPAVTVVVDGVTLDEGVDYTVTYDHNIDVGTNAAVAIVGIGDYTGTVVKTFTITPASIADAVITPIPNQTYTGSPITPPVVVTLDGKTLVAGVDYDVTYTNNVELGTATVTVTGKGNYAGTISTTFEIVAAPLTEITATDVTLNPTTYTYDGTEKEPAVTVVVGGVTLTEGVDYTVTYADNIEVGTATATIVGIGDYTGTVDKTFTITPASISGAVITPIPNQTYTGSPITPPVTVTLDGKTLVAGVDYDVTYTNNVELGTATVTVTGKGNYAGRVLASFNIVAGPPATPGKPTPEAPKPAPSKTVKVPPRTVNPKTGDAMSFGFLALSLAGAGIVLTRKRRDS